MTGNFDHGGNIFSVARAIGVSPEDIIDFSASINPLGLADGVREAVCAAFDRVLHYPDSYCAELREALARYHNVDSARVMVANGSTELIYLVPRLTGGVRGLVVAPAFSEYAKALSSAGMEVDYLILDAEDGFCFPLEEFERKLAAGYDVVFICNPGNPSGALVPLSVIETILDLCRAADALPVLDEAFMDFCEEGSGKYLVTEGGRGMVLRSMTKFFAVPGLRIGYAMASPDIVRRLESFRGPWSVNTPAQVAGVVSLGNSGYIRRTLQYVETEKAILAAGLAGIGSLLPFPSAANYLLVKTAGANGAAELREKLMKRLILIRDCSNFRGLDGRFFRVAVRKGEENARLVEALREICG
ncbi:MAG TPA: threonine-phosphate decarboxylase CobD [Geobacteraceae bacterium]|nr:threonine-phosphate decarboxylase CobD [Geobacteraceae bacterium]